MTCIFITCISTLSPRSVPVLYNNGSIEAIQTNEACCKYLMKRGPRPNVIIALCTRDATEKQADDKTIRSYAHFEESIRAYCAEHHIPVPKFCPVRLYRNEERNNHFGHAITKVLGLIQEFGERHDTRITVDTAGGPRNISIMMQTMTRLLRYNGYDQVDAYYTNLTEHRIFHDHTNQQLAIIEAIATFVEHGTAQQLAESFRNSRCEEVRDLADAMQDFSDSIQLCKTENLPDIVSRRIFPALDRIEAKQGAQANKEDVAAIKQMVNYIRYRFGYNPFETQIITPVSLMKWCLECGYVQQAVTLFTENIPKYLVDSGILTVQHPERYPAMRYHSKYSTWLYCDIMDSCQQNPTPNMDELTLKIENIRRFTVRGLRSALPDFRLNLRDGSEQDFQAFLCFYVYIKKKIRNHLNHAIEDDHELTVKQKRACRAFGIDTNDLTPENITNNLLQALNLLENCRR